MSLQERLALNTGLYCAVANHFSLRPALFEVCARLLVEQWSERQASHHDPLLLYLVSIDSTPQKTYVRPLYQALAGSDFAVVRHLALPLERTFSASMKALIRKTPLTSTCMP